MNIINKMEADRYIVFIELLIETVYVLLLLLWNKNEVCMHVFITADAKVYITWKPCSVAMWKKKFFYYSSGGWCGCWCPIAPTTQKFSWGNFAQSPQQHKKLVGAIGQSFAASSSRELAINRFYAGNVAYSHNWLVVFLQGYTLNLDQWVVGWENLNSGAGAGSWAAALLRSPAVQ